MWRAAPELHLDEIAIAGGYGRLHHILDVALPVGTAGNDERTHSGKGPVLVWHEFAAGSAAPPMVLNFQIEVRSARQVGFEGERFTTPPQQAYDPLQWGFTRQ